MLREVAPKKERGKPPPCAEQQEKRKAKQNRKKRSGLSAGTFRRVTSSVTTI